MSITQRVVLAGAVRARAWGRHWSDLGSVNEAIAPLLERLNDRPMRRIGKSRRQIFEEIEHASLRSLPEHPYVFATFATATVNIDYHVDFEGHFYSAPYQLAHKQVDI